MTDKPSSKAPLLLIAAVALFMVIFSLSAGMHRVLVPIPDDAAYYFKIAENAAGGRGLTFDGINRTNGFQPLWLYLLTAVYAVSHGTPEMMCRIILIVQIVLLAAAAAFLHSLVARFFSRRAAFVCLALFGFFVFIPSVNGMESAILVLSLSATLFFGASAGILVRNDAKREPAFGMLLGLLVLARLDMIFAPLVVFVYALVRVVAAHGGRRLHIARAAGLVGGWAVVVAPYLIYNRVSFGAVMPISGALKSSFPAVTLSGHAFSTLGVRASIGLLMALGYLVWSLVRHRAPNGRGRAPDHFRTAMSLMAGAIVLHFLHSVLFMKWAVFRWHYVPYAFFGVASVCEPVERAFPKGDSRGRDLLYWSLVAAIVVLGSLVTFKNLSWPPGRDWRSAAYDAGLWARENTAKTDVFAMKDAGNFGYFSERRVINLDGLVNNREYQAALRERSLKEYLVIKGVRFFVQHAFWDRPDVVSGSYDSYTVGLWSHLYECASDSLVLRREDEAYRSRPYLDGPHEAVFVIWKMRGAGSQE
jgi:hypothetical protein